VLFGINQWKRYFVKTHFPDYYCLFVPNRVPLFIIVFFSRKNKLSAGVWGNRNCQRYVNLPLSLYDKVYEIEDGFIRSVGLGIEKIKPISLLIDSKSIHFDRARISELEHIISNYKHSVANEERAKQCIRFIKEYGIDKYNLGSKKSLVEFDKDKEYILVIGQVDSDDSIKFSCIDKITSNELVYFVKMRHPKASIIYRPHPEVLRKLQLQKDNYQKLKKICFVDESQSSLSSLLTSDAINTVYTISSLSGFESLLYNKQVFVFGSPFYSDWSLTRDVTKLNRRGNVSLEGVFYCSYIVYPTYICPIYDEKITIEEALIIVLLVREGVIENGKINVKDCNIELYKSIPASFNAKFLSSSRLVNILREI
ncbi:hypothetical protein AB4564_14160, partial [Vibrio sp. 10N.222.51.E8]